jgi:DNA-binding response OmpR family regulator
MPQISIEMPENPTHQRDEKLSVLLVDDQPELANFLREYLVNAGYSVTVAHDGSEGLVHIGQRDFDIILSDMMMPKMQGNVFYKRIEAIKPHLCERFILMTGHHYESEVLDFLKSMRGLTLYKPLEMSLLDDALAMIPKRRGL